MLGMLDFRDGLRAVLKEKVPERKCHLSEFRGKELIIDGRSMIDYFQSQIHPLNFFEHIRNLKSVLAKFDATMVFVDHGLDIKNLEDMVTPCNLAIEYIETFFYMMMIYNLLSDISDKSGQECFQMIMKHRVLGKDSLTAKFMSMHRYQSNVRNSIEKLGVPWIIAPQHRETQVAFMVKQAKNRLVFAFPSIIAFPEVDITIDSIDVINEQCSFFHVDDIASTFSCTPQMFRKCVIAAMAVYNCDPLLKKESKLAKAITKGFDDFPVNYLKYYHKNRHSIEKYLNFFVKNFTNSRLDTKMPRQIARMKNLDDKEVFEFISHLKAGHCINERNEIVPYPSHFFAEPWNRFTLSFPRNSMVKFFCHWFISDDIAHLLNHNCLKTLVIVFPKLHNVEMTYAFTHYYKSNLEKCFSSLIETFKLNLKAECRINFMNENVIYMNSAQFPQLWLPESIINHNELSFYHTLKFFKQSIESKVTLPQLKNFFSIDIPQIRTFLKLNLLSWLGYFDFSNKCMYVPGATFLKARHSAFKQGFEEEIIIMLELIRYNFLKPSIMTGENKMLGNQIAKINDHFISLLVKRYVNNEKIESILPVSKEIESTLDHSCTWSKQSSENEYYDDPQVLSDLDRKLLSIQRAVKDFQKMFVRHIELGYSIDDFEEILNDAFNDKFVNKILLISRFFPFVSQNFHLQIFLCQDSYMFRELINLVIKSITNINNANFMALLAATGNLDNDFLINTMKSHRLFRKNYSVDISTFIKILLCQFSIYKSLSLMKHPLAELYHERISMNNIIAMFDVQGNLVEIISRAKALFGIMHSLLTRVCKFTKDHNDIMILREMTQSFPLFDDFCAFYQIPECSELKMSEG